jgi:hypothetical protein
LKKAIVRGMPLRPRGEVHKIDAEIAWDAETGVVRVTFDVPITWFALEPKEAVEFAKSILNKAGNTDE